MSNLLEEMKLLNEDHAQDGYPAVKMCEINGLIGIIESQSEQLAKAKEDYKTLFSAFESCQDELKESNERVKELETTIATAIDTFDKYEMDVDTYPTIEHVKMKSGLHECLNKFAIENKTEVIAHTLRSYKTKKFYPTNYAIQAFNDGVAHLWAHIESCELQLRKEQE